MKMAAIDILKFYLPHLIYDIDTYMGIKNIHKNSVCIRWMNFSNQSDRKRLPAEITFDNKGYLAIEVWKANGRCLRFEKHIQYDISCFLCGRGCDESYITHIDDGSYMCIGCHGTMPASVEDLNGYLMKNPPLNIRCEVCNKKCNEKCDIFDYFVAITPETYKCGRCIFAIFNKFKTPPI